MSGTYSRIGLAAAGGALLLAAAGGAGACELRISRVDDVRIDGARAYDVFSPGGSAERFRVRIERVDTVPASMDVPGTTPGEGDALDDEVAAGPAAMTTGADVPSCRARMRVEGRPEASLSRGGERLNFGFATRRFGQSAPLASIERTLDGLEPGEEEEFEFDLVVPPGQFVAHGSYVGGIAVTVAPDERVGSATPLLGNEPGGDREIVPVVVEVGATVRVSFAGTEGRSRVVDFGELKAGARPAFPVELLVQASSAYTLRFHSENGGRLRREASGKEAFVAYELHAADQRVALAGSAVAPVRGGHTERGGQRLPLDFRIADDTLRKPAGRYVDRLTVEIVPTNLGF